MCFFTFFAKFFGYLKKNLYFTIHTSRARAVSYKFI